MIFSKITTTIFLLIIFSSSTSLGQIVEKTFPNCDQIEPGKYLKGTVFNMFCNGATLKPHTNDLKLIDDPIEVVMMGGSGIPAILESELSDLQDKIKLKLIENSISVGKSELTTEDGMSVYKNPPQLRIFQNFIVTKENIVFNVVFFLTNQVDSKDLEKVISNSFNNYTVLGDMTLWSSNHFGFIETSNKNEIMYYYNIILDEFIEDFKSSR